MNQSKKIFPVHKVLNHIQITNMKVACLHNGIYVGSKTQRRIEDNTKILCRFTRNQLSIAKTHYPKVCYGNISKVSSDNNDLSFAII